MPEMSELKPCPFCGGPGIVSWSRNVPPDVVSLACARCGARIAEHWSGGEFDDPTPSAESVALRWNRRAPSPVVAEVVKRLRELADGVRPIDYAPTEYNYYAQLADELDALADRLERGE